MYQHHNLEEISAIIEKNVQGISAEDMLHRVTHFVEHLQKEEHVDNDQHQRDLATLEEEFHNNNAGPTRNVHLSTRPKFMYQAHDAPCLWNGATSARSANDSSGSLEGESLWDRVSAEADSFRQKYHADVQFIFSHVQHHWHALDDSGNRIPLKYCRLKGRKGKALCKQGFPKKVLRHKNGKLKADECRVRIVCQGVAGELNLNRC